MCPVYIQMQGFQRTVLIIAAVMLVISLIVLGTLIRNANENVEWPPQSSSCPDYWTNVGNGVCQSVDKQNTGISSGTINTTSRGLATPQQRCDWAMKNKVMWDGITDAAFCEQSRA